MPPTIIITSMSPSELLAHAIKQANAATDEIHDLETSPFEPGETTLDRALLVARHAFALAEAWTMIEALISPGFTSPQPSQPSSTQGCAEEGTN